MKLFTYKIFYFLIPIIFLSIPIDYMFSYIIKKSHLTSGEYEVWNDIYQSNINCDIAIYGSSRAWVHVDPKILADTLNYETYNFGINGHNFWLQYLRHIEFIKYNPIPKKIILSLDVFTLEKQTDLFLMEQFLPYMLWNENIKKYTSSSIGFTEIDYSIPLVRYFGKLKSLLKALKSSMSHSASYTFRKNGYRGMNKKWNSDFQNAKDSLKEYRAKIDVKTMELFENFIIECNNLGIDLTLIYTPEYVEGQKFVVNRFEIINTFKQYAIKYNLLFLDYSQDSLCLNKNMFYNSTHLNKVGSKKFSQQLASDLKKYSN